MSFERIHPSSSQTPQTASGPSQFASRSLPAPAPKRPRDQEDVNGLWIQRMEGAKARSNLLEILIRDVQTAQAAEPATGSVASVQPKLTIGQPNDHYEQELRRIRQGAEPMPQKRRHPSYYSARQHQTPGTRFSQSMRAVTKRLNSSDRPMQRLIKSKQI
jgi:hypothetical protein